jgi:hypothetical protein
LCVAACVKIQSVVAGKKGKISIRTLDGRTIGRRGGSAGDWKRWSFNDVKPQTRQPGHRFFPFFSMAKPPQTKSPLLVWGSS